MFQCSISALMLVPFAMADSESLAGPARMNTVKRGLIELTLSSGSGSLQSVYLF